MAAKGSFSAVQTPKQKTNFRKFLQNRETMKGNDMAPQGNQWAKSLGMNHPFCDLSWELGGSRL